MSQREPYGLDAESADRVVRSLLVVRIVRGSLLLVFLVVALIGVEAKHWPTPAAVAVVLALLAQAASLAASCRRYGRARRPAPR